MESYMKKAKMIENALVNGMNTVDDIQKDPLRHAVVLMVVVMVSLLVFVYGIKNGGTSEPDGLLMDMPEAAVEAPLQEETIVEAPKVLTKKDLMEKPPEMPVAHDADPVVRALEPAIQAAKTEPVQSPKPIVTAQKTAPVPAVTPKLKPSVPQPPQIVINNYSFFLSGCAPKKTVHTYIPVPE